jgi:hypothetical protein
LGWYISGGDDRFSGIDEEEGESLPMAWFGCVFEVEGVDGMLVKIWVGDYTTGL